MYLNAILMTRCFCHEFSKPPRFPLALRGKGRKGFVTPTERNVHRDALRFMVMGPSLLQKNWRLAVGGWRRLAVGGWRSLGAVFKGGP